MMTVEQLRNRMYDLLNETNDMKADDVMAAVGCVHERVKYHFHMSILTSERAQRKVEEKNHEAT
jgi:hypothetical protein